MFDICIVCGALFILMCYCNNSCPSLKVSITLRMRSIFSGVFSCAVRMTTVQRACNMSAQKDKSARRIHRHYVRNSRLSFGEDRMHEFKGHRNLSCEEVPGRLTHSHRAVSRYILGLCVAFTCMYLHVYKYLP